MKRTFSVRALMLSSFALSLLAFAPVASAQTLVVVDDTFGDGDLATNTDGTIGTGFAAGTDGPGGGNPGGGIFSEANGFASLSSEGNGGRRAFFASNEFANLAAGPATFLYEDVNFFVPPNNATGGDTNRTYIGFRGIAGANDAQLAPGEGFYVQFGDQELAGQTNAGSTGVSSFVYIDAAGVSQELGAFTFDNLAFAADSITNAELDVQFTLDGADYGLAITGDTAGNAPINFSGTLATAPTITSGYAFAFNQSEQPSVDLQIGRVLITETAAVVPEPTSLALIGLGSIGMLVRRRRR